MTFPHTTQIWLFGIALSPTRTSNEYNSVARLKPGATLKQAETEMDSVSAGIDVAYQDLKGWRADPLYLREKLAGDVRPALLVLLGAVTFVLLIACANVANLMLARGAERSSEFAVRKALGASQLRVILQVLTESLLISIAGGGLGVLLALWGKRGIATLAPRMLLSAAPGLTAGGLDARVLALPFGIALATTLLFGLVPALRSARRDANDALKEAGRSSLQSGGGRYFRNTLVSAEIALSMVLLVGAGLMIRTLGRLGSLTLGFDPSNVLTMRVPLAGVRYTDHQTVAEFWRQVVASVETLPGVESASVTRGLPIEGWAGMSFTTAERPNPPAGQVPDANYVVAGPGYFRTLRIPIRAGRFFAESDGPNTEHVAIVNAELARRHWPLRPPIGKIIRMAALEHAPTWLHIT